MRKPLSGLRILVTRGESQASELSKKLEEQGAEPVEVAVIEICEPHSWNSLDTALSTISSYDWIVFASTNAVSYTLNRATTLGAQPARTGSTKIAAIGSATRDRLRQFAVETDFFPTQFTAEKFIDQFISHYEIKGKRFLLPRTSAGGTEIADGLKAYGGVVDLVEAYSTKLPTKHDLVAKELAEMVETKAVHVITFASAQTARNFSTLLKQGLSKSGIEQNEILQSIVIATIGPKTSKVARELFLRIDVEAHESTIDGLVSALAEHFDCESQR